jgi:hypothetical protein
MHPINKLLLACVPVFGLAACGGSDTADRLDLANPALRFVHASAIAPNLTLYRGNLSAAMTNATNVAYPSASNYFDIDMGVSDWLVDTAVGSLPVGTVSIAPQRGTKYTIVALPTSNTVSSTYLILDPYNKSLTSNATRFRLMNASFNAGNIDLYMYSATTDIAGVTPTLSGATYKTSKPISGDDSISLTPGNYQVTITTAGTKTILFKGQLALGQNEDTLLLTVPDALQPGAVKALVKTEGTPALVEIAAS